MNANTEGDLVLDGLIEGRLAPLPGMEQKLREWVGGAKTLGLGFGLEVDGGRFSLLPDNAPHPAGEVGADPAEVIGATVEQMLKFFPPGDRGKINSTLRSIEVQPGKQVQTLYGIEPDGSIHRQQRVVPARTRSRIPPLTPRERRRMRLGAVVAVLGMFAVSTLFLDYRGLWRDYRNRHFAMDAREIAVELPELAQFITITDKRTGADGHTLVLTLQRTGSMPTDQTALDAAWRAAPTLARRLALEAIAKGYARAEMFDDNGVFLDSVPIRIQPLREQASLTVPIPIPPEIRPKRLVIGY